jgi:hypothetical protein
MKADRGLTLLARTARIKVVYFPNRAGEISP